MNAAVDQVLAELPPEQTGPAAWYGPATAAREDWIVALEPGHVDEIDRAVRSAAARAGDIAGMTRADFPLPTVAPVLADALRELLHGRGFALLRGLPVERMSRRDAAIAFFGIGTHLGGARAQNASGHLLGHVIDAGLSSRDPHVRIYQTSERQTYHTDSCDVVALMCMATARRGGLSTLVSSTTIFNEMRRRRPDLLAHLLQPIATDRRGEVPAGMRPWFEIPVFSWHEGHLTALYHRPYIDSAQRFPEAPRLGAAQIAALDLFDELTNDPALHLHMEFRPGDVQLVHNHTVLHDRTAFEDWDEPARRRHLLRLWLACPGARPLPARFAERYGSIEIGNRGGIVLPDSAPRSAPVEPA
ncbi:MAG TPA: TauD/TfdA family dioxygenase [Kofleriaceae bacterium]|nr:TauD/TfdA family dioxygenase [Kofleriaceae bacterium]